MFDIMAVTLEQQKVVSHPLRSEIIGLLANQAMTAKQVARRLEKNDWKYSLSYKITFYTWYSRHSPHKFDKWDCRKILLCKSSTVLLEHNKI